MVVLGAVIVGPGLFGIYFVMTVAARSAGFVHASFFIVLYDGFRRLLRLNVDACQEPADRSVARDEGVIRDFAMTAIRVIAGVERCNEGDRVFSEVVGGVSVMARLHLFCVSFDLVRRDRQVLMFRFTRVLVPYAVLVSCQVDQISADYLTVCPASRTAPADYEFRLIFLAGRARFRLRLVVGRAINCLGASLGAFRVQFFRSPLAENVIRINGVVDL